MRILFDSKKTMYKEPFGTISEGQSCTLRIHIPSTVGATQVQCLLYPDRCSVPVEVDLTKQEQRGAYDIYSGSFTLAAGLYFYHFVIFKKDGSFRLFKHGDDTNMEAGDSWQLTCTPKEFHVPDWAKGAVIYQVFPDRFHKCGDCDLTGKLTPYSVHAKWNEEVDWKPNEEGLILNNDFFGGNFKGITEKLPYIASLGVSILYLNPICKSFSSHRYDTGDYKTPDPMLGTEADFTQLCQQAHELGIKVILDGVFSHTGADSLYFNKYDHFTGIGAYNSPLSPYYSWYQFKNWPNEYISWWNFDTLPTVNKLDPAFIEYIITGEDSVIAHWLNLGCDGFRLDVADELPNEFMDILKKHLRKLRPDALLMGEVWEDASNKEAYGVRRRYFTDGTLDSVMNYPFRTAILNYIKGTDDGGALRSRVLSIMENYPQQVLFCNMNLLGTHDTPRILTALVDDFDGSRAEKAERRLTAAQKTLALSRLHCASFLQYMLPGCPALYYGDEAGMEGYADPFNRRTYPWGKENALLLRHYRQLGQLRKLYPALRLGETEFFCATEGRLCFKRRYGDEVLTVYVNRGDVSWEIPAASILYGQGLRTVAPDWLQLGPMGFCVTK